MSHRNKLAALFVCAWMAAGLAGATQTVNFTTITKNSVATTSPIFVVNGDVISFEATLVDNTDGAPAMGMTTARPDNVSAGLGLCLSYNNAVIGTPLFSQILANESLAAGGAQMLNASCNQEGGTVGADANTMIIRGWGDSGGDGWPVDINSPNCPPTTSFCDPIPFPVKLYTGTFTVNAAPVGKSEVAFSAQDTHEGSEPFSSNSPLVLCGKPTVSVIMPSSGNETGSLPASFIVSLSAPVPAECGTLGVFPVSLTLSGAAAAGTDYSVVQAGGVTSSGANVTIAFPADGMTTTATVLLTPADDSLVEGDESVTLTATAGSGNYLGVGANATTSIADNDASVSVVVTQHAGEPATNGIFTFTRTGFTGGPLTVNFTLGGSATVPPNLDFDYTVTAGAGATAATTSSITFGTEEATAVLNVNVVNDAFIEGTETVGLTIGAGANYLIGVPNAGTMNIADDDFAPEVSVTAHSNGAEPGTNGSFTITRSVNTTSPVSGVGITVGGSAARGTDYVLSFDNCVTPFTTNSFPILPGVTSLTLTICVQDDGDVEGVETVSLTINSPAIPNDYTVGAQASRTANIADDDGPVTVSIVATTPAAAEPGTNGLFTVTRSGGGAAQLNQPMTVNLTISGSASNGTDYQTIANSVIIPMGQTSVTIPVTVIDDPNIEGTEAVTLAIAASGSYTIGAPSSATVNIADDDVTINVTITASLPNAAEPNVNGQFTVTRTSGSVMQNAQAYTVNLSIGGSATNGGDYTLIASPVIIPANQTSVTIPVTVQDDNDFEGIESVIATVTAVTGGNPAYVPGNPSSATVNIADDEIGISVTRLVDAEEGGSAGIFEVCRTGSTSAPLVVTFSLSGSATEGVDFTLSGNAGNTITIPMGQNCAQLLVTVFNDGNINPGRDVQITLIGSGQVQPVPGQGNASMALIDDERPRIIPTMSDWGLLLMGLMLAGIAGFSVRRRRA